MDRFNKFIERINPEVHNQTRSYISTNLAVFEPETYILDQEMFFDDYHFILFYSTPPPARVDKKPYQFKKGNLVSFVPGSSLTVLPADRNEYPVNYLDITIKKDFFQNIASEFNITDGIKFKRIETAFSHRLIESIVSFKKEIYFYGDSIPLMVDSISTQIVVQLLRDINGSYYKFNEKTLRDQQSVNRAIDYMQSYFSAPISIEDICQTVDLSPHYFIRLFKQQTDQTPYQYLMAIRIERAKSMLVNSNYTMGEVANICGFVNPGHFATLFKRYEGISPTDYRKQKMGL